MKILQIIHTFQNRGAEIFASQLSNHLQDLGNDVRMIALFSGSSQLPFNGNIFNLDANRNLKFIDYKAWKRLAQIIKEFKPDLVQANAGDTLKYAVFSKLIFGWNAPIISRNASEIGRYIKSMPQFLLNKFLYRNVEEIISVSHASKNDIINHFPFLEGKTSVLPVGLEEQDTIESIKILPENSRHIIHVGGFSFEKNHTGVISIFGKIHEKLDNVQLHLIGDGPLKEKTHNQVKKLGLENSVKFYGFVTNPLSYIKAADVLILPSIIEGLPGVLLEAMYCKIPVVAYNVGGISEIVNSQTGELLDENDEENFYKAVIQQLNNPSHHKIENAYSMVRNSFMNKKIAEDFQKIYSRVKSRPVIRALDR